MLNKWRAWQKPVQEENWRLLEELEMEGLAEGSCGAQGCWGRGTGAGGPSSGTAGTGTAPRPSKGLCQGNPCSFISEAAMVSGLTHRSDPGVAPQKNPCCVLASLPW